MTSETWPKEARLKAASAQDALRVVKSGQRVYIQGGCAVPEVLVNALIGRANDLHDVEIVHLHTEGPADYIAPAMTGHFRHNALFMGANVRAAVNAGLADYTPVFLSDVPQLFQTTLPLDVALLHVSPPDRNGYCSLGISVDVALPAAQAARTVIAQVNPRMPRTLGDSFLHVSEITALVEGQAELLEAMPDTAPDPVAPEIGRHVATLITDGSVIQLGIGAIPNAVLSALTSRRHLGVHTEMFSDGLLDLIEAGIVDNELKNYHVGKTVASFVMGSRRLYDFVDDNPMVEMHPVTFTNDPGVIARNDNMVAINSAIEVDLTGQVCADSIGHRFYSGLGGQLDFVRGAARSKGGKSVIALPATALGGSASRIVTELHAGAGVVTTRGDVEYVVTEYGVASLHGRTVRQRAQALIAIAHPQFRQALQEQAAALHLA